MSIRIMTEIWEYSPSTGTELLMMLAIADHANDDRECWPSIARLAHKCRLQPRMAQNLIARLVAKGELERVIHPGRKHTNTYWIPPYAPEEKVQSSAPLAEKVQSSARKGAIAIAPESSLIKSRSSIEDPYLNLFFRKPTRNSFGNICGSDCTVAYFELTGWYPTVRVQTQIDGYLTTASLKRWSNAIQDWLAQNNEPREIAALIEHAKKKEFRHE